MTEASGRETNAPSPLGASLLLSSCSAACARRDLTDRVRQGLELPAAIGVSVETEDQNEPPPPLEAWPFLARAAPSRRREFLLGRRCARAALAAIGGEAQAPLPVGSDRRPHWPEGWTGSISHADGVAGAVVAREASFPHLGFDVEPIQAVTQMARIASLVVSPTEHGRLGRDEDLLAVFCGKEALFKALYAGRFMDFSAAELVSIEGGILVFRLTMDWGPGRPAGLEVVARRVQVERWIFTAVVIGQATRR